MPTPKKKPAPPPPAGDMLINVAPSAAGRLSDAGVQRLKAQEAEAALPGWQSLGKGHKPTHANLRQGPRERKVRW